MSISNKIQDFLAKNWVTDETKKSKINKWMLTAAAVMCILIGVSALINIVTGGIAFVPFLILATMAFLYVVASAGLAAAYKPSDNYKYSISDPWGAVKHFVSNNGPLLYWAGIGAAAVGISIVPGFGGLWGSMVVVALGAVGFFFILKQQHKAILVGMITAMCLAVVLSGIGLIPGGALGLVAALGYVVPFTYWAGLEVEMIVGINAQSSGSSSNLSTGPQSTEVSVPTSVNSSEVPTAISSNNADSSIPSQKPIPEAKTSRLLGWFGF
jgi:hypothetical protein